ncbi:MAG: SMP-30/gluconolactonase/LRE family protein [Bacteroidota bacterium]
MLRQFFSLCFALSFMATLPAQIVSTLLTKPGQHFEGITWAKSGEIYVVDFVTGQGFELTTDGQITEIGRGNGALGGTVDEKGNFYYSEFNTGNILKIDTAKNQTIYCSGLIGPAGILIDEENQIMYVANYSGNSISKIDMAAETIQATILASGGLINGPDGLVFDPDGNIISANFNNNNIQRITPEGEVTRFATISSSPNSGYIVRRDDQYIIAGAASPNIYSISLEGEVRQIAGTGVVGYQDGEAAQAQFNLPNGVALSPSGDTLILTESSTDGRIRLLTNFDLTNTIAIEQTFEQVHLSPNPASDQINLKMNLKKAADLTINLIQFNGTVVDTLTTTQASKGIFERQIMLPSNLDAGIYLVQIVAEDQVYYEQLVKQ